MKRSRKNVNRTTIRIRNWMNEQGMLTVKELAEMLGVDPRELSFCINLHPYRTYPNIRRKLAMKMGVSYERLWGEPANTAANRRRQARKQQLAA